MDRYFKLRIPFGTKSYIRNQNKKLIMLGNANYIYDTNKNKIVDWYLEIINSNFLITNKNIMKPTEYYEKKIVRDFRDNFLDKYSGKNDSYIQKYQELTKDQIQEVNKELRTMKTTISTMFSLFSGSNISGAEQNHKASPIRCIDNEYFNCNFLNPIKKFLISENNSKQKEYIDLDMKTYSLTDVFKNNLIPGFKEKFEEYNQHWVYRDYDAPIEYKNDDIEIEKTYPNDYFKINEKQEDYIYAVINKTLDNFSNITKDDIKRKLRSFYTSNVQSYIRDKKIPIISTVDKFSLDIVKNAHIISFSSLVEKWTFNSLKDAINPYNCLRIDGNTHDKFDRNTIFFKANGSIVNNQYEIIKENYINIDVMPNETKRFFNEIIVK